MDSHSLPNTISDPTVVIGGQSSDIQQILRENSPTPLSETLQPQTSADSQPQQPLVDDNDVEMDSGDYDEMPDLQEVSDSSDSEAESESDRDANEVEMQAVDHNDDDEGVPSLIDVDTPHDGPSSSSTYRPSLNPTAGRPSGNRRARVEDDEDDERDRRHPSQRVSSANINNPSATSSSSQTPAHLPQNQSPAPAPAPAPSAPHVHRHIIRASIHLMAPNNTNNNNNNNPVLPPHTNTDGGAPQPALLQQPQHPQQAGNNAPRIGGVALSFEIGPGFHVPQGAPPQPGQQHTGEQGAPTANGQPLPPRTGHFADILGVLGRLGGNIDGETIINFGNLGLGMHQEKDDPERAKKLVAGLEVVPVGLVRRLERVGGAGGGMGEEPTNGGDAGCAICWDKLLDGDGEGFGKEEKTEEFPEAGSSSDSATVQPKIVSLPCAHVFHADCLLPWFARPRHTTCPTCRFNVDPENLTHESMRRRERREHAAAARQAEGGENSVEGEQPTPEALAGRDFDGDAITQLPPDFLAMMGATGEMIPPEEVEMQNRQMAELLTRMEASAQLPPPPPGLLTRLRAARGPSAQTPAAPAAQPHADDATPAQANPAPSAAAEANPNPAPAPHSIPAAGTPPPRVPGLIQTPHGPIGILPVPVMIPVSVPAAPPGAVANPNGAPQVPTPAGNALPGHGDFARLLSRMIGIQQPVPFNSLFPGLRLNGQQHLHPQPQPQQQPGQGTPQLATPGNAAAGGSVPVSSSYLAPQFLANIVDPLNLQNLPRNSFQPQAQQNNAATPPPVGQATPQQQQARGNSIMEIRVDMVFGPGGAFPFPTGNPIDNRQGGAERRAGQAVTPEEADAFMQQMENEMVAHENEHAGHDHGPEEGIEMGNDALHREVAGRLRDMMGNRDRTGTGPAPAPAGEQTPGQQPEQAAATPPPAQQPGQQLPFGAMNPAFLAGLNTGMGMGMHFTGSGRSVAEAFSQMFGGLRAQQQQERQGQAAPAGQPQAEGEQPADQPGADGNAPPPQQQQQAPPPAGNLPPGFTPFGAMFPNLADIFGGASERRAPRPRKDWTLPAAPGPTLRQRIERREREAGLRCYDVSCGIGPSDEDPFGVELGGAVAGMKQLSIMSKEDKSELCSHTFHGPCLVSAERVALKGADAIVEDGNVEVSCPVCRGTGCVSKADWDEGVDALM